MKFRKKPIIVEAEQWFPGVEIKGVEFAHSVLDDKNLIPIVKTLEGNMIVSEGDWIITGIEGERYPCKDSIFQKTYESVNED